MLKATFGFKYTLVFFILTFLMACRSKKTDDQFLKPVSEYTLAFGSCNKQSLKNYLWDDIRNANPDIWIWGGDNIYADTSNINVIANMYDAQKRVSGYRRIRSEIPVIGTWDDHDYGINDGGTEWSVKGQSQQAFLDFLEVPSSSPRRLKEGIYTAHNIEMPLGRAKIIVLDTRYFRSSLTKDSLEIKRYVPNTTGKGTILGESQWSWLEGELTNSRADFNILISSIQFLSDQHGYETWGNFPNEVERLKNLIVESGARGVFILSGDRHISEFSKTKLPGMSYALIDFTSSGLTHAYSEFKGEPNPYRLGDVVSTESFGLVSLNFSNKTVRFQMIGDKGVILGEIEQQY